MGLLAWWRHRRGYGSNPHRQRLPADGADSSPSNPDDLRWDPRHTQKPLTISADGLTLSWIQDFPGPHQPAWLASQTTARLRDGVFSWEFLIEAIADRQIGVGIMLDPPNWGFFGYLGAGSGAWAYDAYEGAIVTEKRAILASLPRIASRGVVSVHLDLKSDRACTFIVDGVGTPPLHLPACCTIVPAACLLKKGQVVTLGNFRRLEEDVQGGAAAASCRVKPCG